MSRKYSKERFEDLQRRINKLTVRVHMALHKQLDKPLLKALKNSLLLVHDKTHSRLKAITSSSSHTIPTFPPPTTIIHTDLDPAPYRSFSPPIHPPTNILLRHIPPSTSSFDVSPSLRLLTPPLLEQPGTARCIESGSMAADTIDDLPRGYRRVALLVFDRRHPPNERIASPPLLRISGGRRWCRTKSAALKNQRRRSQALTVV